jgi:hypothetical protein
MANNIILKKSSQPGKVPTTSDLQYGEVALNYADGKLFYKNANNEIDSISNGSSTGGGISIDFGSVVESVLSDQDFGTL